MEMGATPAPDPAACCTGRVGKRTDEGNAMPDLLTAVTGNGVLRVGGGLVLLLALAWAANTVVRRVMLGIGEADREPHALHLG